MLKKLTINIESEVYDGLYSVVGAGKIGQFINDTIKPHVLEKSTEDEYKQMVMDEDRNREAEKWTELGKSTIRKSKNVW